MPEEIPSWWPSDEPTTTPDERQSGRFEVNLRRAERDLVKELERIDATDIRIDRQHGSRPPFPGIVVHWIKGGTPYSLACDTYTKRRENMRACGLTLQKLRHVRDYNAVTTQEAYQGLERLPPTVEQGRAIQLRGGHDQGQLKAPHEVLGVAPDAPPSVVTAAFKVKARDLHPDRGGDEKAFSALVQAREAMLDA